jgi:RNA polymerase sigma factor (sigma-70 family)
VEPSEVADTVRRAAEGDKSAWNALVENFSRMIWGVAYAHRLGQADAGEVVQTTWLRLVENLDRITYPERVGGWLATTARNESLRQLRLRGREVLNDDESWDREPDAAPTPEAQLLDRDRDRRVLAAFERLSQRCRTLLQLVVVVAPPYAEVAAALDMPIGSIGPTRARCLERLRRLLADDGITSAAGGA